MGEDPVLLAPMEDVSDPPFRILCKEFGCDMMYTEFVSVEGLVRNAYKSIKKLELMERERPIGIQIFGSDAATMVDAVKMIEPYAPDVIDINFGCPVKKVVSKGAGAALLQDTDKMVAITEAITQATHIPVTVKTRLGWDKSSIVIVDLAERLQDAGIKALTIHARTRNQMYKGEADWTPIGIIKKNPRIHIPVFGNGDIDSPQKALEYKNKYKVDGIMVGRAAIGNPWIFREIKFYYQTGRILPPPTVYERIRTVKKHLLYSIKWKGERLGILEMRKHYAGYFKGFKGIKRFKLALVTTDEPQKLLDILDEMESYYS